MKKILPLTVSLSLLGFNIAFAADDLSIIGIALKLSSMVYQLFIILSVIGIIIAAFMFLTSGGSQEKVGNAKKALVSGIIAILIAVLAGYVTPLVADIMGVDAPTKENCMKDCKRMTGDDKTKCEANCKAIYD
jgi:hypothetical protein